MDNDTNNHTNNHTTIVTSYFQIKSKFPHKQYLEWMKNMLYYIASPMVIFTDKESEPVIKEMRKPHLNNTRIIITSITDFYCYQWKSYWNFHYKFDPEQQIHSPELYMIWAEKTEMVRKAIELNPFNSEFYLWSDIGCFRNRTHLGDIHPKDCVNWPSESKVEKLKCDKVYFDKTGDIPELFKILLLNGLTKHPITRLLATVGGLFILHKNMMDKWHQEFYNMLQLYFANNRFAGKDQTIMANVYLKNPEIIELINVPNGEDKWFYFLKFLL